MIVTRTCARTMFGARYRALLLFDHRPPHALRSQSASPAAAAARLLSLVTPPVQLPQRGPGYEPLKRLGYCSHGPPRVVLTHPRRPWSCMHEKRLPNMDRVDTGHSAEHADHERPAAVPPAANASVDTVKPVDVCARHHSGASDRRAERLAGAPSYIYIQPGCA